MVEAAQHSRGLKSGRKKMKKCFVLIPVFIAVFITACSSGNVEKSQEEKKDLDLDSAAITIDIYVKKACGATKPTIELVKNVVDQMEVTGELNIVMLASNSEANEHKVIGVPTVRVNGIDMDPRGDQVQKYGIT